jgi:hypothetical protein
MNPKLLIAFFAAFFLAGAFVAAEELYHPSSSLVVISFVNQNPDPVGAGNIVELKFMVENYGSREANNLEFELMLDYPFSEVPGENYVRTIKTLAPLQTGADAFIIKYRARVDSNAVKGTNRIRLKQGVTGSAVYSFDSFGIEVTGTEFAQIIYVDKAKLDPGKETELKFTITNVGNSPLSNLVFSWSEKNGVILPVYSDDTKYIRSIDVGGSVDILYTVVADVNAESGLYQLDLTLEFEAEGGTSQKMNTKAGIFIGGETDFDVTFSESSEGQTSLSVANTGNNPALSVTVRIPEQESFRVTGSTSSIIGNLDKGDYTIVSFQISQGTAGMPGMTNRTGLSQLSPEDRQRLLEQPMQGNGSPQNELKVQIEYTDTTGVRHTIEKSVPIQFRSLESSGETTGTTTGTARFGRQTDTTSNMLYYAVLVPAVIGGIVCYKKRALIRSRLPKFLKRR